MVPLLRQPPPLLRALTRGYASSSNETLVVVGGGWAGYNFVRKLDKVGGPRSLDASPLTPPSPATTSSSSAAAQTLSPPRSSLPLHPAHSDSATSSSPSDPRPSSPFTILGQKTSTLTTERSPSFRPRARHSGREIRSSRNSRGMPGQRRQRGSRRRTSCRTTSSSLPRGAIIRRSTRPV